MATFKTRINKISKTKGKIILANDYESGINLQTKTLQNIKTLNKSLCAIKINFHLLLPLGLDQIKKINQTAHKHNLLTIADIKLNDIGNTNKITLDNLWKAGFDGVIANPIMGHVALKKLVTMAHAKNKGVIALCHMSAPEAKTSYEMQVKSAKSKTLTPLYQLFLKSAIDSGADGIIVGATYPEIVKFCKKKTKGNMSIYSPGIGTQGGDINKVVRAGTDFLIVGRSILNSKNPKKTAERFCKLSL